ncbi:uncharacterized protein LOC107884408 [Acyrthosiphon pisum]|uniref:Uncharacterized protein n=1 Tax=Acyrthosiphon pisum TaxID=7029 RepID=A0A8R2D524_ACYPI|nr:uncharacterized protein LOC107884408 [Acyrthosiphon pisum]|eukprot:XP_016661872.1 PREDICTED: uncharacterized protein LOC107884408 [Acyrthosiphon pisum]
MQYYQFLCCNRYMNKLGYALPFCTALISRMRSAPYLLSSQVLGITLAPRIDIFENPLFYFRLISKIKTLISQILFKNTIEFITDNYITIVVWKSENGKKVDVTFESTLPYIDHSTCRKINTDGFNQFVTFDKFCTYNKLGIINLDSDCSDESSDFLCIIL